MGRKTGFESERGAKETTAQTMPLRRLALRQVFPLSLSLVLIWLLWDRFAGLDFARIHASFFQTAPLQWLLAAGFTGLSFWAVGRYDVVAHRMMRSGLPSAAAARGGWAAIAVAQSVGLGVISSALMRWRLLPGLSLYDALRLAALVSVSFLAGWAVVAALAVLTAPEAFTATLPGARLLALAVLSGAGLFVVFNLWRPGPLARLPLPPVSASLAFVGLAALDTIAAGAALYVLLPVGHGLDLYTFLAGFLIALGAGLVSGTPGGAGPFELTLLALLPALPEHEMLAAILAFRLVYYALPALAGAAFAIVGPVRVEAEQVVEPRYLVGPDLPADAARLVARAPRAEAALLSHGRLGLLQPPGRESPALLAHLSGQSLIALSDPLSGSAPAALDLLARTARASGRIPVLYKCGARMAWQARREGWRVRAVAEEAWLDPCGWDEGGAARRQLRRKLRKAVRAGLRMEMRGPAKTGADGGQPLPVDRMAEISAAWAAARGGERGFSMGHFDPDLIHRSRLVLAWKGDRLVGFMSFHANASEWVLDLVRFPPDAPDGVMHMAVTHAIGCAAREGAHRFSLAAVPLTSRKDDPRMAVFLNRLVTRVSGGAGLRQFKQSFGPNWERLYLAAPGPVGMALAGLDLWREITRPPRRKRLTTGKR